MEVVGIDVRDASGLERDEDFEDRVTEQAIRLGRVEVQDTVERGGGDICCTRTTSARMTASSVKYR